MNIHIALNNNISKKMGSTCLSCASVGNEIETAVTYNEKTDNVQKDACTPEYIISTLTKASHQVCIRMGPIYRKMKLKNKPKHII